MQVSSAALLLVLVLLGTTAQAQSATRVGAQNLRVPAGTESKLLPRKMQALPADPLNSGSASNSGRAIYESRDSSSQPFSSPTKQSSSSGQVALASGTRRLSPVVLQQPSWESELNSFPLLAGQTTFAIDPAENPSAIRDHSPSVNAYSQSDDISRETINNDDFARDSGRNKIFDDLVSNWGKLEINGHVRIRHETDFQRINRPTRNRLRLRARLQFLYAWNDQIKGGIRWTTGDRKIVLEPGDRGGSPLSYQDAGDVFDKFEFNLDRIFIAYTPDWFPDLTVTIGKFAPTWKRNPIFSSPIGSLVWDEAAQPEGVAVSYAKKDFLGFDQLYSTIGESAVLELSNQADANLFFLQLWGEKQLNDRWRVAPSLTWYNWSNPNPEGNTDISTEANVGNSVTQVGVDTTQIGVTSPGGVPIINGRPLFRFDSGFNIVNPVVAVTYDDGDEHSGIDPTQFVYEAFHNNESFDAQRSFGYSIGMQYGPAVTQQSKKQFNWKAYYSWNDVQQESVFSPVAEDDFLLASNFRGHWIGLDIYPWDDVELRFWMISTKPIIPITVGNVTSEETQWRMRADITAYF